MPPGRAWRFIRERTHLDRIVCNVLLTAGALVIAAGFSAAKITTATGHCTLGSLDYLGAYEAIGMAVMFAGFLSSGGSACAPRGGVPSPGRRRRALSRPPPSTHLELVR